MAEQYIIVWNGVQFASPNKVRIDQYGNRYMEFSDGKIILVWRRDDLEIDHSSGACKPRDVSKKPIRTMAAPIAPAAATQGSS